MTIHNVDFKSNIRRFWDNVNWKKTGKHEIAIGETAGKTAMQAAFEKADAKNSAGRSFEELTTDANRGVRVPRAME